MRRLLVAAATLLQVAGATADAVAAEVTRFSPQGTVKGVRQVTARFSEPMVPLGDPRGGLEPFELVCPEAGTGRWLDSRTWAYDFERELPGGLRCVFSLRPGLVTLGGAAVDGSREFAFTTGGPAILRSEPPDGDLDIDEEQAFVLTLDAEPTEATLLGRVGFTVDGVTERVGVRVVTGRAREAILRSRYRPPSDGPVVVLQARQRFPNRARVTLVWGRGVQAPSGVSTEQDQELAFRVRPPFTATFRCERENPRAGCVPVAPMSVELSAPVARDAARRIVLVGPDGGRRAPEVGAEDPLVSRVSFKGPFPESSVFRVEIPPGLRDDAGRPLGNAGAFPLAVRTETFPPLAKFSARFGIVEWRADPTLPVSLRRLEPGLAARLLRVDDRPGARSGLLGWVQATIFRVPPEHSGELLTWLRRVGTADRESSVFDPLDPTRPVQAVTLPGPGGSRDLEVVGIPLPRPGLYVVELQSARLGASLLGRSQPQKPLYVPTAALVTNLSVHFKWGRESSLAWVTTLDTAAPVAGARVTVYDCRGTTLWRGDTDRAGIARVGGLPARPALPTCPLARPEKPFFDWSQTTALAGLGEGLLVVAQTVDDLSLVHSSWDRGIEPWRFRLPEPAWTGPIVAHTVLDRPLFRAGETVSMKHLVRLQTLQGLARVPEGERPTRVSIRHGGSQERHDLALAWDAAGSATSTWRVPAGARLGRYEVVLVRPAPTPRPAPRPAQAEDAGGEGDREWPSAELRVEEFRVPLLRGTLRSPAEPLVAATELPLDVGVRYLAGGAAREHPVTVRAQVRPRWTTPGDDLEGFAFANGAVRVGLVRRGRGVDEEDGDAEPAAARAMPAIHQRESLTLDGAGTARVTITRLPVSPGPIEVLAELEFRDPNGEVQTVATVVPVWPAARLVGIKPDGWVASRDRLRADVAVVDVAGRPVAAAPVAVEMFTQRVHSHRKRLVGGFYAYEHVTETRRAGELCRGVTGPGGVFACEGKPPADGSLVLQATVTDEAGRTSAANQSVWVAGSEEWWFEARDHDRMDVLPERRRYEPGETARLQVRMPFREATALVAVEREGVHDAFVTRLSGREPVVEVPVGAAHAPNTFVSVLAVRGRVGGVEPGATVDLGRPTFKLGVAEIRVGWRPHELRVQVTTDRPAYRVRDRATARIAVRTAAGQAPPPGSEVAVAAVDEGLLELAPNPSWNVLETMMGRRGHGVLTATAQMQVVGKRHYGLKALPPGGGGGRQATRELFDTLLLWRARVALDHRGDATVEVPLGDAVTSVRVVAVATGGSGFFGTGAATLRVTQDLMILPGLPPVVREGDRVRAEVTLRNATTRPMDVTVRGSAEGLPALLAEQRLSLAPGEAHPAAWDVQVPAGVSALAYVFQAAEAGGPADRVRVVQRVVPAVPVRTLQATLTQWDGPVRQPVARPADALPGAGGVEVLVRPTLLDGLAGVKEWMRRYPYTCLEQRVSRAVALRDEALWREVVGALPAHLDQDGLLKFFSSLPSGSEVLTAYVLSLAHAAGWPIPDDSRERTLAALRGFVEGGVRSRFELPTADLAVRKLAALEALARHGQAEPRLLSSVTIEPALWPTSAVLDWWSLLRRIPGVPDRERRLREAERTVRARLDAGATMLRFSTEGRDGLWWLMASPDVNAMRLILHLIEWGEWTDDVPRLVRGAIGRQRQGAWGLTVANAWGVLAVERFSTAFEGAAVSGTTTVSLGGAARGIEWARTAGGGTVGFPWATAPVGPSTLVVDHAGAGRPWVTVQARAAVPLQAPLASGYRIQKTVTPVEPAADGRLRRGDLLRVRLAIEAEADMGWVAVTDPIPAGASHVGTGLGGDSRLAAQGEAWRGRAWPAFVERGFEAFRAYYAFVPRGRLVVEYTIRLGPGGRLRLPPTRVEALYAPEVFGELPNAAMEVEP